MRAKAEGGIGDLAVLPRAALVERWQRLYGCNPPKGASMDFMVRAIAYEMQVKRYGGLKTLARKKLKQIVDASCSGDKAKHIKILVASSTTPGTRLIREWNGVTHAVDVTDDGFEWRGEIYRSLSAIAREITGARWSGPRFFGLNGRAAS